MEYKIVDTLYHELNDNLKIMRVEELEEIYIILEDNIFIALLEEPKDGLFYIVDYDPFNKNDEDMVYVKKFNKLINHIVFYFESKGK